MPLLIHSDANEKYQRSLWRSALGPHTHYVGSPPCSCPVPAVDDHGSRIRIFSLLSVHLVEEAEDTTRLLRDAVVGPAHVLVVPDGATSFWLRKRKYYNNSSHSNSNNNTYTERREAGVWRLPHPQE